MGGFSWLLWPIVAALFGYVWMLVKLAKPKPIAKPIKDSKAWLIAQTVLAWPLALFFGYKTLGMLAPNSNLQRQFINPNPGSPLIVLLSWRECGLVISAYRFCSPWVCDGREV